MFQEKPALPLLDFLPLSEEKKILVFFYSFCFPSWFGLLTFLSPLGVPGDSWPFSRGPADSRAPGLPSTRKEVNCNPQPPRLQFQTLESRWCKETLGNSPCPCFPLPPDPVWTWTARAGRGQRWQEKSPLAGLWILQAVTQAAEGTQCWQT